MYYVRNALVVEGGLRILMKPSQTKLLVGIALLLIIAVAVDLVYYKTSVEAQTLYFENMRGLFQLRPLLLVIFYSAFFTVVFPLIMPDGADQQQTWILIGVGLVILIPLTFPTSGQFGFTRYLYSKIISVASSQLRLTINLGSLLAALGFFWLFRNWIQKRQR